MGIEEAGGHDSFGKEGIKPSVLIQCPAIRHD